VKAVTRPNRLTQQSVNLSPVEKLFSGSPLIIILILIIITVTEIFIRGDPSSQLLPTGFQLEDELLIIKTLGKSIWTAWSGGRRNQDLGPS